MNLQQAPEAVEVIPAAAADRTQIPVSGTPESGGDVAKKRRFSKQRHFF